MDKRLQIIFFQTLFFFDISYISFLLFISNSFITEYSDIFRLMLVVLVFVLVAILFSIIRAILQKDYVPDLVKDVQDSSLFMYMVLNLFFIFGVKNFYLTYSKVQVGDLLTYFFIANYVFLVILGFFLIKSFLQKYKVNNYVLKVQAKRYFVIFAYVSPMIIIVTLVISVQNIIRETIINLYLGFLLIAILMAYVLFFKLTEKTGLVLVFKHSDKEEIKELIDQIYTTPESLESYLNPKMKVSIIANIITVVILVPIYVYTLVFI